MNRIITYAYHKDDGLVISRVGNEIAHPVLEYEKIGQNGDFRGPIEYKLEKMPVTVLGGSVWDQYVWTKKIPMWLKNRHRRFWGFKPLKRKRLAHG